MNLNPGEIKKVYSQLQQLGRETNRPIEEGALEHLIENIYLSIADQLRNAAYFRAVAEIAPDQFSADILMEFAQDEREHAYQFQQAYEKLTGKNYTPPTEEYEFNLETEDYEAALEKIVLEASSDHKKYKDFYLMTHHQYLRDIFFNALIDKSYQSIRAFYLLYMAGMGMM